MFIRRGKDATGPPELAVIPLSALRDELRRRGFDALPAGAFAAMALDLEGERERLRQRLGEAEANVKRSVELGLDSLGRGTAAEIEAERLAAVAMSDTINRLEGTDDDD